MKSRLLRLAGICLTLIVAGPALANGVGENTSWQFQTSADKVNQAAVQDMIQKRRSGFYAAPVYNTYIGRQFNCNVTATAAGNDGSNSTVANSPSNTGASAGATGNANTSSLGSTGTSANSTQGNSGAVGSSVLGSTNTAVQGAALQALNSTQSNSGAQSASVGGSTGCTFGVLN